jgi:hypothetical protein
MPRPGPRRPAIALRLSDEVTAQVDELAEARGLNRSGAIRLLIDFGLRALPKDWTPPPGVTD